MNIHAPSHGIASHRIVSLLRIRSKSRACCTQSWVNAFSNRITFLVTAKTTVTFHTRFYIINAVILSRAIWEHFKRQASAMLWRQTYVAYEQGWLSWLDCCAKLKMRLRQRRRHQQQHKHQIQHTFPKPNLIFRGLLSSFSLWWRWRSRPSIDQRRHITNNFCFAVLCAPITS